MDDNAQVDQAIARRQAAALERIACALEVIAFCQPDVPHSITAAAKAVNFSVEVFKAARRRREAL